MSLPEVTINQYCSEVEINIGPVFGSSCSTKQYEDPKTGDYVSLGGATAYADPHCGDRLLTGRYRHLRWEINITDQAIIEEIRSHPKEEWLDLIFFHAFKNLNGTESLKAVKLAIDFAYNQGLEDGQISKQKELQKVL